MDANWKDKGLRGDMRRGCVRGEGKGRVRSAQLGGGELLIANLLDSYTAPSTPTHIQTRFVATVLKTISEACILWHCLLLDQIPCKQH